MRTLLLALAAALVLCGPRPARAETPPEPRFDRVDHARPQAHLALAAEVGDAAELRSIARQLEGDTDAATLAAISRWLDRNLRRDARAAYRWRSLDEMLEDRTVGGCADHAAVFGTLARAAGIPCVWVKTMDLDWIRDFRAGREGAERYRGHVFLEVHVEGRWQLLDAQAMRLYEDYDPATARLLPGCRFAYDKGDDPFELVLSCRWELWKRQTDAYFRDLDPAALPWGRSRDLLAPWRVWIAGDAPRYGHAAEACRRLGFHVAKTFNTDWERNLAQARGRTLIVTCTDRRPVLPQRAWDALLPAGFRAILRGGPLPEAGYLDRTLADGTRVVLVPGEDATSIQVGVARALRER